MRKWDAICVAAFALTIYASFALAATQTEGGIAAALGAGNPEQAELLADTALGVAELAPADQARLLVDRGIARESLARHDEALADLTQAIEMHALRPADQARALFTRGAVLDGQGRSDDAIGDYNAALVFVPHFAPALNNRANIYRRQNRATEAKRDYLASLAAGNLQPEYSYYGLGQLAEAAGNPQGARAFYAQAVAANPDYGLAADRLAALGGAADTPGIGVIHLKPPKSAETAGDAPVILKPPASPRPSAPSRVMPGSYGAAKAKAGLGLRPALDAAGQRNQEGAQVQLGAWRTEAEAGLGWNSAVQRAGRLLDGLSPRIVAADLPGKGRYYRLRVGPARAGLCTALQAQGLDCIPVRD